jgi:hypothetical protein
VKPGACCREGCEVLPESKDDVFCAEHWRALPRWARVELVALRNAARRGGAGPTTDFVKALLVAAHLPG